MSGSVDTPFMRQYNALRREEPAGAVLLVRTGGYYNAVGMDAETISAILPWGRASMLGAPAFVATRSALGDVVSALLRSGVRVSVAEQVEDVRASRGGVVRREVMIRAVPSPKSGVVVKMTLRPEYYNAIRYGEKRIEYRDMTDYWEERLWANGRAGRIAAVTFYRGNAPESMTWRTAGIVRNASEQLFEIYLAKPLDGIPSVRYTADGMAWTDASRAKN